MHVYILPISLGIALSEALTLLSLAVVQSFAFLCVCCFVCAIAANPLRRVFTSIVSRLISLAVFWTLLLHSLLIVKRGRK